MANINSEIKMQGNDDTWFTANAAVVFADNIQIFHNDGRYKFADGVTALSALPFLGGGSAQTLAQTLANGNSTGSNNIIISSGKNIQGGTGLIDFYLDKGIALTSDSGAYVTPYVWADNTTSATRKPWAGLFQDGADGKRIIVVAGNEADIPTIIGGAGIDIFNDKTVIYDPIEIKFNTPANNFPQETASQIAYLDASKNLKTLPVANYPSLAELAFVKGLTSSAQTQITAKLTASNNLSDVSNPITSRNNLKEWDMFMTTGDQSTTSSSAVNITDLVVTVQVNKRYKVSGGIHVGCNNTGGVKIAFVTPSGTMFFNCFGRLNGVTAANFSGVSGSGTLTTAFNMLNNSAGYIHFDGEFSVGGTGGDFQLQFASGVGTQTSTIYQSGTQITITQIN